jgi:DGQHR domain-containing protein
MSKAKVSHSFQKISVIVPKSPFAPASLPGKDPCLCALDVEKLMEWWPGTPHSPHRDPTKVKAIQRSLDWKRVAQIAAYLLQEEIIDAPERLKKYFSGIYEPLKNDPGREWPPKIAKVIGFQVSEYPTFSNILVHINGAETEVDNGEEKGSGKLIFDESDKKLVFSIIDGQHRINGAYLAICIRKETDAMAKLFIPAEVFLDLDPPNGPAKNQAQIFIDVNYNQKKVDRSLVADLYPTARAFKETFGYKERAQDIGRKLMLEIGPLVGMIQIPGIRYGVKDVITLSTLNGAIEGVLDALDNQGISNLETQTEFLAQCLTAWFEASGRFESKTSKKGVELNPQNVVYQGRVLVSLIALTPAMLWKLNKNKTKYLSDKALKELVVWLKEIASRANMLEKGIFISKEKFKARGYLGSGGIGRFRDSLWAVISGNRKLTSKTKPESIANFASENRGLVFKELNIH